MEVTAYCACQQCTDWKRGFPDFWNRYVSRGPAAGRRHSGRTASGRWPRPPHPGLFSLDSLVRPWTLPGRLVLPWLWLPRDGTVAADTRHYPFGTRVYVPGWGYGRVEDRGGAIRGDARLDLFFKRHARALQWGRRKVPVRVYRPN